MQEIILADNPFGEHADPRRGKDPIFHSFPPSKWVYEPRDTGTWMSSTHLTPIATFHSYLFFVPVSLLPRSRANFFQVSLLPPGLDVSRCSVSPVRATSLATRALLTFRVLSLSGSSNLVGFRRAAGLKTRRSYSRSSQFRADGQVVSTYPLPCFSVINKWGFGVLYLSIHPCFSRPCKQCW